MSMDRYEEAMSRCKQWEREHTKGYVIQDMIEFIFPELSESVDERIRKEMIDYFEREWRGIDYRGWIAYLEKHKEQPKKELGKYSEEENLAYRLNWVMQDYYKAGKDDEEREHRFKCYKLFWDSLEDTNFFEQKERKHAGWSEEDKKDIQEASEYLRDYANNCVQGENSKFYLQSLADRIESLSPQPHWKPSEEQMGDLSLAATMNSVTCPSLKSLYDDLKKL